MCKNAPDAAMNSTMPLYNPISSTDLYPTGTSATYQCLSGYAFAVGISDNLSCYDGNWYHSTAPKCPKVCKPAPGVRIRGFSPTYNVDVVTSQPTTYRTGTTATYTCPLRFRFRDDVSGVLTCNNGSWNATFAPECEPGIRCMTCTGTTHESCDRSGRNVTCQRNEGQCGVEVRTFEQGEKLILKYCKQEAACFNDRKQNELDCRDGFPNSVCRCCCNTRMCSIGNSGCALN
uniref:Sushi domain-containing protein n=1 Tax=Ciona savignyi TaxID=51511 RepID=H2ZQ26_CIOSA